MTQEEFNELATLVTPIIEYINKHYDLHTCIIIDSERFDVYQAACGGGVGFIRNKENK